MWALVWAACEDEPVPHIVREEACPLGVELVSTADLYGTTRSPSADGTLLLDLGPAGGLTLWPTLAFTCLEHDAVSIELQLWIEDEALFPEQPIYFAPEDSQIELSLRGMSTASSETMCTLEGKTARLEAEIIAFDPDGVPQEGDPHALLELQSTVELGSALRGSCAP
jgi:hypothetical protein